MITSYKTFKKQLNESMVQESLVTSLINQYLPNANPSAKDELSIFIDHNIDLESREIERFLQIIAKI